MAKGKWQLRSKRSGNTYLSLTKARIERWIEERRVEEDEVWRTGFPQWKKVGEVF